MRVFKILILERLDSVSEQEVVKQHKLEVSQPRPVRAKSSVRPNFGNSGLREMLLGLGQGLTTESDDFTFAKLFDLKLRVTFRMPLAHSSALALSYTSDNRLLQSSSRSQNQATIPFAPPAAAQDTSHLYFPRTGIAGSCGVTEVVRTELRELKPNAKIRDELKEILNYASSQPLNSEEKDLIWKLRFYLARDKRRLTKFLKSVTWRDPSEVKQVLEEHGSSRVLLVHLCSVSFCDPYFIVYITSILALDALISAGLCLRVTQYQQCDAVCPPELLTLIQNTCSEGINLLFRQSLKQLDHVFVILNSISDFKIQVFCVIEYYDMTTADIESHVHARVNLGILVLANFTPCT
ncbi:hypothetical protein F4604DRAFT_1675949 [Suillus subluteus]|nr:hypothetical protein F4604DRAFT_1675949 [Suillus subluteus]